MKRVILALGAIALVTTLIVVAGLISLYVHRTRASVITPGAPDGRPGTYLVQVEFGGRQRDYLLHLPPAVAKGEPLPLVLALHGGGGDASHADAIFGLTPIADAEGFLVVLPDAIGKNWNDGRPDARTKAAREGVDDVGFIEAVLDDVGRTTPVDSRRIYATGISNGGFMANRLVCEAAGRIAAIAIVAATAPAGTDTTCRPSRPVPVIAFNGTKDLLVPYNGGEITVLLPIFKRGKVVSADALRAFWTAADGCDPTPETTALPDLDAGDGSTVTRIASGGCNGGADVVFYRIDGGGHTWPGGKQYLPEFAIGHTNRDISASTLLWAFFAAHPLP